MFILQEVQLFFERITFELSCFTAFCDVLDLFSNSGELSRKIFSQFKITKNGRFKFRSTSIFLICLWHHSSVLFPKSFLNIWIKHRDDKVLYNLSSQFRRNLVNSDHIFSCSSWLFKTLTHLLWNNDWLSFLKVSNSCELWFTCLQPLRRKVEIISFLSSSEEIVDADTPETFVSSE
jgi:hypothetical protein